MDADLSGIETVSIVLKFLLILIFVPVDVLLLVSVYRVKSLHSNPVFLLSRTLVVLDITSLLVSIGYDIPSRLLERKLFEGPLMSFLVLLNSLQWFVQLFLLPLLAAVHFVAVFKPLFFRRLALGHAITVLFIVFSVAVAITIPLFTECCGFTFYVPGYYWSFDFSKPYTPLYNQLNIILQSVCVGVMIFFDILIVVRVAVLRKQTGSTTLTVTIHSHSRELTELQTLHSSHPSNSIFVPRESRRLSFSTEVRLAFSFLLLSLCFILPTISFNVLNYWYSDWAGLIRSTINFLYYAKWTIYLASGQQVRTSMRQTLKQFCHCFCS